MEEELKKHYLFQRLTEEQLKRVASRSKMVQLADGQSLFQQGDPATRFYLVVQGRIKLFRLAPEGNEKVIELVDAGNIFAEALMFLNAPRYLVGSQALGETTVVSVDAEDFLTLLRDSVELCLALLADMSFRLRALIREIDDLSLHSATCRVAAFLLSQAPENSAEFELDVPKHVIASRLSVKPETFSRIIKNLKSREVLEIRGSHVRLLDRDALKQVADVCALPIDAT
ncbi:MAG: Crp/Fnr family transcriptional regulator [Gammaproteobacteria bacterium]|nr:MAG: Crp/Fnr family transcriptional regulator [Gammaproteobacteria bacterium]RTZ74894.1 MAG: Crp/Fnr family transcriptional regulator [Gammaproteobacteria bacterium]